MSFKITLRDSDISIFKSSLHGVLNQIDNDKVLTIETRAKIVHSLADFNCQAILKFINGQIEHGGNLKDRNLDAEIRSELVDLFWYNAAKDWK